MRMVTIVGILKAFLPALAALVIIYIATANIQKIAAFFDKLLKRDGKPPENDGLYDIYALKSSDEQDKKEDGQK